MLSRRLYRQGKQIKNARFFCTEFRYPEGTVPGILKAARAKNEWLDVARFDAQKHNWTVKEFDVYSTAFAYGLVEQGFEPGDKLMVWLDAENSAEAAVAQVGALKHGVSIVTVDHRDEIHHVGDALESSGAKGLLLSPHTKLEQNTQRANLLLDLIPELADARPGQKLVSDNFPNLSTIIHTGHSSIRGTSKFKENMLYTHRALTNLRIATPEERGLAMECYKGGRQICSYTNSELLTKAKDIWKNYLNGDDKTLPVFLTLSLQYPLGFATFLSCIMNERKIFVPSTFNLAKIAKSFSYQQSDVLICEEEVFGFQPPQEKLEELNGHVSSFKKVVVGGSGKKSDSNIFKNTKNDYAHLYLQ